MATEFCCCVARYRLKVSMESRSSSRGRNPVRRGEPGAALGDDALLHAQICNAPVDLFQSPLNWLRGGCHGACILEWIQDDATRLRLLGIPKVRFLDSEVAFAQAFDRWLHAPDPALPSVFVRDAA